jgi:hypothetical protein
MRAAACSGGGLVRLRTAQARSHGKRTTASYANKFDGLIRAPGIVWFSALGALLSDQRFLRRQRQRVLVVASAGSGPLPWVRAVADPA